MASPGHREVLEDRQTTGGQQRASSANVLRISEGCEGNEGRLEEACGEGCAVTEDRRPRIEVARERSERSRRSGRVGGSGMAAFGRRAVQLGREGPLRSVPYFVDRGRRRCRKGGCKSCNLDNASRGKQPEVLACRAPAVGFQALVPRPPIGAGMHVYQTGNRVAT